MTDAVTRELHMPAPPEEVWRALTDPAEMAGWLAEEAEIDLRPGGDLSLRSAGGDERSGWVEEVDAERRLVYWWSAGEEDEPTRVELDLQPEDEGTRLTVHETRPLAAIDARAHDLALRARRDAPRGPQMLALA